jgi:hypothetical protein
LKTAFPYIQIKSALVCDCQFQTIATPTAKVKTATRRKTGRRRTIFAGIGNFMKQTLNLIYQTFAICAVNFQRSRPNLY